MLSNGCAGPTPPSLYKGSGENELLALLGGEYSIYMDREQRFVLLPGGFIDFVGGETVVSVLLALGYMH